MKAAERMAGHQVGQGDPAEHLEMAGAEVECRFLQRQVEALQAGHEQQHGIGRDEAGLGDDGQEDAALDSSQRSQNTSVEMPMITPGVSSGDTITA